MGLNVIPGLCLCGWRGGVVSRETKLFLIREVNQEPPVQSPVRHPLSYLLTSLGVVECHQLIFLFLQDNNVNVIHIESRRSQRQGSMYEIFSEIEIENSNLENLVSAIKDQVCCRL